jgi:hypothetical protein
VSGKAFNSGQRTCYVLQLPGSVDLWRVDVGECLELKNSTSKVCSNPKRVVDTPQPNCHAIWIS